MPQKTVLLTVLDQFHQQLQAFIAQLSAAERAEVGTLEQWSPKDIVAHDVVWALRHLDNCEALLRGEPITKYGEDDDENAVIFNAYRDTPWDEIERLVQQFYTRTMQFIQTTSDEDLHRLESPERGGNPVWQGVVYGAATHSLIHVVYDFFLARARTTEARDWTTRLYDLLQPLADESPRLQGVTLYNRACLDALSGYPDAAIEKLREALRLRPDLVEWSQQDTDLDSLRERADYQALYA